MPKSTYDYEEAIKALDRLISIEDPKNEIEEIFQSAKIDYFSKLKTHVSEHWFEGAKEYYLHVTFYIYDKEIYDHDVRNQTVTYTKRNVIDLISSLESRIDTLEESFEKEMTILERSFHKLHDNL